VPATAIRTADTIVAISQAEAVVPPGFGAAAGAAVAEKEAVAPAVDGRETPAGTPSRVRVAVSRGVPRSHPAADSGWPKPCCPGSV
jgi:hypothetical protein